MKKRKTPTNRYYELKQKIKKKTIVQCTTAVVVFPPFTPFSNHGQGWGVSIILSLYMH